MRVASYTTWLASLTLCQALDIVTSDATSLRSAAATLSYNLLSIYANNVTGTPDYKIGVLPEGMFWWNAGAVWDTMTESWAVTGDMSYVPSIMQALSYQAGPNADFMRPEYTNTWGNDDIAFWVFGALSALEYGLPFPDDKAGIPGEWQNWLSISDNVFNGFTQRWDTASCNGGLKWQVPPENAGYDYKNSVSNGGFFQVAARLYRYTGNQTYLDWAGKVWDWSARIGLIDPNSYNVYDGSDDKINCTGIDHTLWTYNAGTYLGGAAYLYNATAGSSEVQKVWGDRARALLLSANSTFTSPFPNATNVIYETTCELNAVQHPVGNGAEGGCNQDQVTFKAFLARWLTKTAVLAPFLVDEVAPLLSASASGAGVACSGSIPSSLAQADPNTGVVAQVGVNGSICAQHFYSSQQQIDALSQAGYFNDLTNGQKIGHHIAALEVVLGNIPLADARAQDQGGPRSIQTAFWSRGLNADATATPAAATAAPPDAVVTSQAGAVAAAASSSQSGLGIATRSA